MTKTIAVVVFFPVFSADPLILRRFARSPQLRLIVWLLGKDLVNVSWAFGKVFARDHRKRVNRLSTIKRIRIDLPTSGRGPVLAPERDREKAKP